MKPILGILGGMGVRASAEFAKTVYEYNVESKEQDAISVILYSDPTFPDRTEAFLTSRYGPVLSLLEKRLNQLRELNASKIVLGCFTLHFAVPMLSERLQQSILSLVDVALDGIAQSTGRQLLFCSNGARAAQIFERSAKWEEVRNRVVFPDREDQDFVHSLLYRYKTNSEEQPFVPHLKRLLAKYSADSFVAGCSELHMLTKHLACEHKEFQFIDPLLNIAKNLPSFFEAEYLPSQLLPASAQHLHI